MLNINNLVYFYQKNINKMQFSLKIEKGKRLAILGSSGSGKSTLLKLIAGFLPVKSGTILIDKFDHTYTHPSKRPISILFQENNLFHHLKIIENIGLGLQPHLKFNDAQKKIITDIARRVGLYDVLYRYPEQISGGQCQSAALARCLIRNQPLLLLDEPFSSLDIKLKMHMLNLLDKICYEKNITLLITLHNIFDAKKISKEFLFIQDNKL